MDLLDRFDFNLSPRTKKIMIGAAAVAAGSAVLGVAAAAVAATNLIQRRRSFSLQGKTVFITGGSRGLGLAMAEEFARRGAQIAICARDMLKEHLRLTAERLPMWVIAPPRQT